MSKNLSKTNFNIRGVALGLMLISSPPLIAQNTNGCWADFYDGPQFTGKHLLIEGPSELANLTYVQNENWDKRIHSIKVGPKATITVYQNLGLKLTTPEGVKDPELMRAWGVSEQEVKEDSELIFNENSMVHDLGDFYFHKKIRSLKITCLE